MSDTDDDMIIRLQDKCDALHKRIAELEAGYRHLLGQVEQGQLARELAYSPSVKAAVEEAKRLLGME